MAKTKIKVSKSPEDLAKDLGLPPLYALEWQIRYQLSKEITEIIKKEGWTISALAKKAGTSRARVHNIIKGDSEGISIDVLLRLMTALGASVKLQINKVS